MEGESSVVYDAIGLRDMKCVECNAVHTVSETWIEIAEVEMNTRCLFFKCPDIYAAITPLRWLAAGV
jgi:hypothetical protein